jgi:hypothetical protein
MRRYSLRTLLVVTLLGGPVLAWGWQEWKEYEREQEKKRATNKTTRTGTPGGGVIIEDESG